MKTFEAGPKRLARTLAAALLLTLTGCAGFFPPVSSSTTTVATSNSGDYVYVVNQTTNTLSEFSLASSALTAISGSPVSLASSVASLSAASVVVTRQNTFVYVGGQGGIACFSIGTGGALTAVSAGNISSTGDFVGLETSPDGQWLLALDGVNRTLSVYSINTSTGALTLNGSSVLFPTVINNNATVARSVRISPNAAYVAIALGTGGDEIFPFTTSNGALGSGLLLGVTSGYSDNALTFDTASTYLYIARGGPSTGQSLIASYSIGSGGALTGVQTIASGDAPYALLAESTGAYLYAANRGGGTVSGYAIASGAFTALSGSPYTSGVTATALAEDNSGKYLIGVALGGSYDYTLYSFDALSAGKLDAVATGASGTDPAGSIAVAATH